MNPDDIPDAAVEAVAVLLFLASPRARGAGPWRFLGDGQRSPYRLHALTLLRAAAPHLKGQS